ncbi:cytochrome P450 [Saccharopolyspora sp. MS10]|uniref:cytochrome P450 n=1 Tax=Saccharopolyspora sp. MS10 TaxID=3385973 RepID=UPI0039A38BA9
MTNPDIWPTTDPAAGCPVRTEPIALHGARFQQNPAALYRQMRQEYGPVAPVLLDGGVPAWLVLGYREIHQVESNPELFARDTRRWNAWDQVPENWSLMAFVGYQPSLMFTEGAEHRRRTGAIGESLEAVDQFELRGVCEEIADDLIDSFAGRGRADLMAEFAHSMPLRVMARLFGLGDDEAAQLGQDLTDTVASDDGVAAYQRIQDRMQQLVERKRENPGADLPSRLLAHPASMTEEEILQDLLVVLTAAQQPVAYWIGNAIRLMLTDERFAVTLAGGRRSIGQALNEVLWEDTPTQNFIGRFASRETDLGGQRIHTGDMLVLGFAAANTDPQVRPAAYTDSIGNNAHMSFGHGEHGCPHPGPEIGQVISRIAIEVLLDRLPDVGLAVPPEQLEWLPSVWMRGLTALPVEFSPSYAVGS